MDDNPANERAPPDPTSLMSVEVIAQVRDQAMFLIDVDGRLASWNLGVGLILGWDAAQWAGQPLQVIFTPEDVAAGVPQAEMRAAALTGRADDTRWMRRRDGQRFLALGSLTRLLDRDGRHAGYLKMLRDVTGRKLEQDDHARLSAAENRARALAQNRAAALQAVLESVDDGVCIVDSAGIRRGNPAALRLLGVTGESQLHGDLDALALRLKLRREQRAGPLPGRDLPFARALRGDAAGLDLWATQPDTGTDVLLRCTATPVRVDGRVVGAVSVFSDRAVPRGARDLDAADSGFGGLSREALVREISHAMRTPLSAILGWVDVLQRGSFDAATIGRGLAAIARNAAAQVRFLDALQAQDRVEPVPRRVDEALPAGEGDDEGVDLDADAVGPRPLVGVTVLVVDDDADVRESTARTLRQLGATVCSAAGADEAFELLKARRPDVLLSDIGMPVVDGHALIRRVRALDADAGGRTPAAALTAYLDPSDLQRALDAGFELHLAKPAPAAALVAAVLGLLGRGGPPTAD